MDALISVQGTRTVLEFKILSTVLLITVTLTGVITILGIDPGLWPVPFSLFSTRTLSFLISVTGFRLFVLAVMSLTVFARDFNARLHRLDRRLESLEEINGILPRYDSHTSMEESNADVTSFDRRLGSDFVPLSATPPLNSAGASPDDADWTAYNVKGKRRKAARLTVLTELDDSD